MGRAITSSYIKGLRKSNNISLEGQDVIDLLDEIERLWEVENQSIETTSNLNRQLRSYKKVIDEAGNSDTPMFSTVSLHLEKSKAFREIEHFGEKLVRYVAMMHDKTGDDELELENDVIMSSCGFKSLPKFTSIRKMCEASGWLQYKPRGTRYAGIYRVSIPKKEDS